MDPTNWPAGGVTIPDLPVSSLDELATGVLAPLPDLLNVGDVQLSRLGVNNDRAALEFWLKRYDSPATVKNGKSQVERLLAWCEYQRRTLQTLGIEDLILFREFLRDPQPTAHWCVQPIPRWLPDGTQNPEWHDKVRRGVSEDGPRKYFISGLSPVAVKQAITTIFGFLEWLAGLGYLGANPMRALARRVSAKVSDIDRYLSMPVWIRLLEHIESLPKSTPRDAAIYNRARFAVRFLYLTGLRRDELCRLTPENLRRDSLGKWWISIIGKGGREGRIPLPADAIACIRDYRMALQLSSWPAVGETTPILRDVQGKVGIQPTALHKLITKVCRSAGDPELAKASAHWLRHTAASHQLDAGLPLKTVQQNLRHRNIQTTSAYLHEERDQQSAVTEKHRLPEGLV